MKSNHSINLLLHGDSRKSQSTVPSRSSNRSQAVRTSAPWGNDLPLTEGMLSCRSRKGTSHGRAGHPCHGLLGDGQAAEESSPPISLFPPGWMKNYSFSWQKRAGVLPGDHHPALLIHFSLPLHAPSCPCNGHRQGTATACQ